MGANMDGKPLFYSLIILGIALNEIHAALIKPLWSQSWRHLNPKLMARRQLINQSQIQVYCVIYYMKMKCAAFRVPSRTKICCGDGGAR